jgi:hypothetical protein
MSITAEEKVEAFSLELERIYDKKVREFTKLCIIHAPDYFFEDCPSSSSGKFHPLDELGSDGVLIHTKKVYTMAYELVKGLACEHNRDLVLAATIIHDLRKQGHEKSGHTDMRHHCAYAAELVDEVQSATQLLTEEQHNIIRCCVGYHLGPWSNEPWKKPMSEYTPEELTVYISDFTVSKRFVQIDYKRRPGLGI